MHPLDKTWEVVKAEFDSACSQSARTARWGLTKDLNQLLRRLRQYRGESEWISILMESIGHFAAEAAMFEVTQHTGDGNKGESASLRLRAQVRMSLPEHLTFAASVAGAFASVIASRDPVVALRSPSEVTEALQSADAQERAHLIPLLNHERVVAVLFAADRDYVDANALELIAGVASVVLERSTNRTLHLQVAPQVERAPAPPRAETAVARSLPAWADLPDAERNQHVQAQRFARVSVAELQLLRPEACHSGRAEKNLYLHLKSDLDRARERFRKQFMHTPSMVDYLHMELVRTAAEGDESKLGAEYPGPLL